MYWADWTSNKIQRANRDGSGVEDLVATGLVSPYGVTVDKAGGKVYWSDFGTDKIQRVQPRRLRGRRPDHHRPDHPGSGGPGCGPRPDVLDRRGDRQDPAGQPRRLPG